MIQPLRDDLMVQQQLPNGLDNLRGAWQHMVAVIMLNQTGRKPVKTVLPIFMHHWPLYGIGKYGSDSYEIFFKQNYAVEPTDKELKRYLEYL